VSNRQRVVIRKLATGVRGLDDVLGGGIPEYSFNLIAGAPGTGKTTLAQQILFANATPDRPGLSSPCSASRRSRCCGANSSSPSSIRRA
jgi:circadian clock protein KaiC